jgi:hypothetical protein
VSHPQHPAGLYAIDRSDPENPRKDVPKPALAIFRFPVTTIRLDRRRVGVWGLLPRAGPHTVWLQRRTGGGWRTLAALPVAPSGMVNAVTALRGPASVRLLVPGDPEASPAASVRAAPARLSGPLAAFRR